MKNYWTAILIQVLCLRLDFHDTGTKRIGPCDRCHLPVRADGKAIR